MRILIRTSRLATWSQRLGGFAAPLLVLSVVLHRTGAIGTDAFEICLAIATLLGGSAVLLGIAAYGRLWFTGDKGWGRASFGLFAGTVASLPAGYAAVMMTLYPSTENVATDPREPPPLAFSVADDGAVLDPAVLGRRFPHLVSRSYQIDSAALYRLVEAQIRWRGWDIAEARAPVARSGPGALHALHTTLLGWRNEIAIRIRSRPDGAEIVMRAASLRPALHDLGLNGRLIEAFFLTLDDQVTTYVREGLADLDILAESEDDPPGIVIENGDLSPEESGAEE